MHGVIVVCLCLPAAPDWLLPLPGDSRRWGILNPTRQMWAGCCTLSPWCDCFSRELRKGQVGAGWWVTPPRLSHLLNCRDAEVTRRWWDIAEGPASPRGHAGMGAVAGGEQLLTPSWHFSPRLPSKNRGQCSAHQLGSVSSLYPFTPIFYSLFCCFSWVSEICHFFTWKPLLFLTAWRVKGKFF